MSILVTGGAGYIGSHTCVALMEAGFDAIVVDNFCNSHPEVLERVQELAGRPLKRFTLDVRDSKALEAVFAAEKIEAVVHFAALKAVGESVAKPLEYYRNNLEPLLTVLEAMRRHECFNLVFSSSATVYGAAPEPPFSEATALQATNPYGRTKLFAEEILRDIAATDARWHIALLRYFNPVGAHPSGRIGESPQGIPNNLFPYVAQVAKGVLPKLQIYGADYPTPDGTGIRDYIHVCDLADGHVAALRAVADIHGAEPINLGTGRGYSVLEVIKAFGEACGRRIPYQIVARRPGDVAVSVADATKAQERLGWMPRRDLDAMCRDAWRWQEMNPPVCSPGIPPLLVARCCFPVSAHSCG